MLAQPAQVRTLLTLQPDHVSCKRQGVLTAKEVALNNLSKDIEGDPDARHVDGSIPCLQLQPYKKLLRSRSDPESPVRLCA